MPQLNGDLFAGQLCQPWQEMVAAPEESRANCRHPVVGGKEQKIHIAPQAMSVSSIDSDDLDLVRVAAFESSVQSEQVLEPGRDRARGVQTCRAHRLQLALTGPIGDAAQMIDVTVAGQDRCHCRQRPMGAACVDREMELREEDERPLSRPRTAGQRQLAP